jgi:putative two-component system response regulator
MNTHSPASSTPIDTILIVDDNPENLMVLGELLQPYYRVRATTSGIRALEIAQSQPRPDLILLDVMMPEMDGYEVIHRLRRNPATQDIRVIFVTAMDASEDEQRGFDLGAADYITKPIRPPVLLARVKTQLELKRAEERLRDENVFLEAEVDRRMQQTRLTEEVSIHALARLAETRDPDTGYHLLRTQAYVRTLAKCLQRHPRFSHFLTDKVVDELAKSAPLHDIGKVGIPDAILRKPGKLSPQEFDIMKTHTRLGSDAIEQAEKDIKNRVEYLKIAKEIAHYHHEHWDGTGYPEGLSGNQIPIAARLMALADVFDALTSCRVYKVAITPAIARDTIIAEKGKQFDPDVVDAFITVFDEFAAIWLRYQDVNLPSNEH